MKIVENTIPSAVTTKHIYPKTGSKFYSMKRFDAHHRTPREAKQDR
ncbi:hypothetical protein KA405_01245 [Patescibacteria group bacterium]|nr:hypothetical protein [Patescibacteria group bacterium]